MSAVGRHRRSKARSPFPEGENAAPATDGRGVREQRPHENRKAMAHQRRRSGPSGLGRGTVPASDRAGRTSDRAYVDAAQRAKRR